MSIRLHQIRQYLAYRVREGRELRKPKKPARQQAPEWDVCRLKSSPAAFVGLVYAEEPAPARAIEEHKIRPADQKRLFARLP